jgi:thiamine-phosphate diphosphorylase
VDPKRLKYYIVVDEALAERSGKESLEDLVSAVLRGGATAIQLRGKEVSPRDLVTHGKRIRALTEDAGVLLIINDRVDIALAVGADGVHLGPDDLPVRSARKICRKRFIIGASVDTPDEARQAKAAGADYLGAGPVFPTETKKTTNLPIGPEGLREIVEAVSIPVVGIGGIGPENIGEVTATGAAGAAVVSAVMGAPDPEQAVRALRSQETG